MADRRTESRLLCADMVDVRWKPPSGREGRGTGLLEDISPSGACLQMEIAVPLGSELRCDFIDRQFTGRVRYCVYREIGYFVGVEFADGCRWSQRLYKPQHLLDLKQLLV